MNYRISFSEESIEPTQEEIGFVEGVQVGGGYSVVAKEDVVGHIKEVMQYQALYLSKLVEASVNWQAWETSIKEASADYQRWHRLLKKALVLSLVLFATPMFAQSFKMCSAGVRTPIEDGFEFNNTRVLFDSVVIESFVKKSWEGECATYSYGNKNKTATVSICGETAILRADVGGCLYYIEQPIQ